MSVRILIGDCVERMREMPDNSVDSVVCDPPYHLTSIVKRFGSENAAPAQVGKTGAYARASKGFMGQTWDGGDVAFQPETWAEVLRVLKPGGHLVAFSGTRTYHRMAVAIEDAGFEVRDMIAWHYGSGFPKSHDISKAIDRRKDWAALQRLGEAVKKARLAVGISQTEAARRMGLIGADESLGGGGFMWYETGKLPTREEWPRLKAALAIGDEFDEAFEAAEREVIGQHAEGTAPGGFGEHRFSFNSRNITAPATDAAREWEGWGTALKPATEPICLARKPLSEKSIAANVLKWGTGALNIDGCRIEHQTIEGGTLAQNTHLRKSIRGGAGFTPGLGTGDATREEAPSPLGRWPANLCHDGSDEVVAGFPAETGASSGGGGTKITGKNIYGDFKGAHYEGDVGFGDSGSAARFFYCAKSSADERGEFNNHPTVKPIALMRWLVRLVTPKGGTVLDPFMGSGSTLIAADAEQFNAIGCELSPEYAAIAERRIRDAAGMFADVRIAA